MKSLQLQTILRLVLIFITIFAIVLAATPSVIAQVSPEEHAKHHPKEAKSPQENKGSGSKQNGGMKDGGKGGMMNGGMGGMMDGGMGGMMDGMMKKMGAPKPKELYPSLMNFPSLSESERVRVKELAHGRMQEGAKLLSEGLDALAEAAPSDNFAAMQEATSKMRQGLAQFESGLAAHRAINEGKAPQNTALNWFKREMNLLPPSAETSQGFNLFGMSFFHAFIMFGLVIFAAAMVLMYFFKMQRAADLLKRLTVSEIENVSNRNPDSNVNVKNESSTSKPGAKSNPTDQDNSCCDDGLGVCSTDVSNGENSVFSGMLHVEKRKLCRLCVAKIISETDDVKTFRLVACHGGALPFSYLPGQFLTFTLPVGEKPIKRSYTISSTPTQGYYCEVTVKREENGAGSCYLHDQVSEGDTLEAKAPSGRFTFTGKEAEDIILISGGVGITPMMSITRALTDICWPGEIYFVVACHDTEHFIFESELKTLQQQHANLHVLAAISQLEKEQNGYRRGRINKNMLAEWVPDIQSKRIHICGPGAMMDAVKNMLSELNVPSENIFTEDFGSAKKPKTKTAEKQVDPDATQLDNLVNVTFTKSGKSTALQPDETILEASERVGVDIDYSCRVGTCGECIVKLLSGNVSMDIDDGLESNDKESGMCLACQAKASEDISVEA